MDQRELIALMAINDITLENVIDAVIESNAIIGVGLISLGEHVKQYIYDKI